MNDERYRRIKQLTQRAPEHDAADRAAFLARECSDDQALLHEVMRLLEDGMGVFYLAVQSVPLRREVVIEVIKLGMDTREVITRLKSER